MDGEGFVVVIVINCFKVQRLVICLPLLKLIIYIAMHFQCPDKPNVTNNIVCSACGGVGHIARDCRQKRGGSEGDRASSQDKTKIDEEVSFNAH